MLRQLWIWELQYVRLDHQSALVVPGLSICLGLSQGIAGELPKKIPKLKKPVRVGTVYVAH